MQKLDKDTLSVLGLVKTLSKKTKIWWFLSKMFCWLITLVSFSGVKFFAIKTSMVS